VEKLEKVKTMHLLSPIWFVVLQLLFLHEILLTIFVWNSILQNVQSEAQRKQAVRRRASLLDSNPECNVFVAPLLEGEHEVQSEVFLF